MRVVMGNGEVKEDLTMKVTLKLDLKVDRATGILETGLWQPSEMSLPVVTVGQGLSQVSRRLVHGCSFHPIAANSL